MLISLILALRYHTCGYVSGTDRGIGLVDVLTAGATRTIGIDSYILLVDVEVRGDLWHNHY